MLHPRWTPLMLMCPALEHEKLLAFFVVVVPLCSLEICENMYFYFFFLYIMSGSLYFLSVRGGSLNVSIFRLTELKQTRSVPNFLCNVYWLNMLCARKHKGSFTISPAAEGKSFLLYYNLISLASLSICCYSLIQSLQKRWCLTAQYFFLIKLTHIWKVSQ